MTKFKISLKLMPQVHVLAIQNAILIVVIQQNDYKYVKSVQMVKMQDYLKDGCNKSKAIWA